jgi:L-iditol 2-dehydrogenase
VEDLVGGTGKGGRRLVIEATNSPLGFRDAVRASRIAGRVVLAGQLHASGVGGAQARPKDQICAPNGRRLSARYRVGNLGRVDVKALVTHREGLYAAPELFEALALDRLGYVKALLYPNGQGAGGPK